MKGIILAGGTGSRLRPLTDCMNKHMLPVGTEPMIWHGVRQLVSAEITEILVVTSAHHLGALADSLGSGKPLGADLTYRIQEAAGGIGQALGLAQAFSQGEHIVVHTVELE